MFQFAHPHLLWLLLVLALLGLAAMWQWARLDRRREVLADYELLDALTGGTGFERKRWRWLLGLAAIACWLIALANPQYGTRTRVSEVKATEVVIALDISQSMLTEDVRPSRLARAQAFANELLEGLDGEQTGLVFFAGQAYLQVPLTTDYGSVKLFLQSANPDQIATQGTNFTAALTVLRSVLAPEAEEAIGTRRIGIVVSDGENHEALAEDLLREMAAEGILLYACGVGTEAGGPVPSSQRSQGLVKRDARGERVISKFEAEALQDLAAAGGGRYFDLNTNLVGAVTALREVIRDGPSTAVGEEVFRESASYYQLFVVFGLVLWLAAWFVGRAGNP